MHQVREFLNFLDYIVGTFWGITLVDIAPTLLSNGISIGILSDLSEFIKILFAIAGLIYLIFRLLHFIRMSKINVSIRYEELRKLERDNFKYKWDDEFLKDK
jgi:hypothetical protein